MTRNYYSKAPGSIRGWSSTCRPDNTPDLPLVYGARLKFWAMLAAVLVALMFAGTSHAAPTIEPWTGYTHASDVFTGRPLFPPPPGCEATTDWAGLGLTFAWGKSEFDLAQGVKARDLWCDKPARKHSESGTLLSYRYYFLRGRK